MQDSVKKSASACVLLVYPVLEKSSRKLRKRKAAIDRLLKKIEATMAALPAPSLEEYEKMVAGQVPVTPEALLLGALKAVAYQLDEASYDLEDYLNHSRADLKRGFVAPRLLAHLGVLVAERAKKPDRESTNCDAEG